MAAFLTAVAVFAVTSGGFLTGLMAFLIFAITMGLLIFSLAFLGATAGQGLARALRHWGRRIQKVSALLLVLIGATLIFASANPGFLEGLLLPQ